MPEEQCGPCEPRSTLDDQPPEAEMSDDEAQTNRRELRIALAMRGGVSLATWIGGAVAELDVLRRTKPGLQRTAVLRRGKSPERPTQQHRAEIYASLLRLARYNEVKIDVLAGASAGGLNAVVYGVAQCAGATVDEVRDLWLDDADMWQMLRKPRPAGRVPSLLAGDRYLYRRICQALYKLRDRGRRELAAADMTVDLSATLLVDHDQSLERSLAQGQAQFHFTRRTAPLDTGVTDFPGPEDRPDATDHPGDEPPHPVKFRLDRLALAARATSSFPGAFEPASIHAVAGHQYKLEYGSGADRTAVPEMSLVFSGLRPEKTSLHLNSKPFHVVDGGIFDNIPIRRALLAICRTAASSPTDRRLVYLDPDPSPSAKAASRHDEKGAVHWLRVLFRAIALKQRAETEEEELGAIRSTNDIGSAAQIRQHLLTQQVSMTERGRSRRFGTGNSCNCRICRLVAGNRSGTPDSQSLPPAAKQYSEYRLSVDAQKIAEILTKPSEYSIGRPALSGPYHVLGEYEALHIRSQLADIYHTAEPETDPREITNEHNELQDIEAAYGAIMLMIAWIRALEEKNRNSRYDDTKEFDEACDQLSRTKRKSYRLLLVADHIRDLAGAELLRDFQGPGGPLENPDLAAATRRARALQKGLHGLGGDLDRAIRDDGHDERSFNRRLLERYPTKYMAKEVSLTEGGRTNALDDIWRIAEELRCGLLEQGGSIAHRPFNPGVCSDDQRSWCDSAFYDIHDCDILKNLEIKKLHTLFAVAGGIPGVQPVIHYHKITGSQRSPLQGKFRNIDYSERRKRLTEWLKNGQLDPTEPVINSRAKLAGTTLHNFGGFLRRPWRANDWAWGRLDAAAGITDMIVDKLCGCCDKSELDRAWRRWVQEPVPGVSGRDWRQILTGHSGDLPAQPTGPSRLQPDQRECLKNALKCWLQYQILLEEDDDAKESGQTESDQPRQRPATDHWEQLTNRVSRGNEGISDLPVAYRYGLVSRVVHLCYRAAWPVSGGWLPCISRLLLLAGRPLIVLLPLAADPIRAATTVLLFLLGYAAVGDASADDGTRPGWLAGVAALMAAVLIGVGWVRGFGNWARLSRETESWDEHWYKIGSEMSRCARRWRVLGLALAAVFAVSGAAILLRWPANQPMEDRPESLAIIGTIVAVTLWWLAHRHDPARIPLPQLGRRKRPYAPEWSAANHRRPVPTSRAILTGTVLFVLLPVVVWKQPRQLLEGIATEPLHLPIGGVEMIIHGVPEGHFPAIGVGLLTAALTTVLLWGWIQRRWAVAATLGTGVAVGVAAGVLFDGGISGGQLTMILVIWASCMAVVTVFLPVRDRAPGIT
ncbi:patatin-like protein [Micromonospora sp. LOL_023]|uniref:patatin-like protein n=1 Tax=Micromonospora sp. LOL_023 TaxID=3345418 RepID=UPI003A88ABC0